MATVTPTVSFTVKKSNQLVEARYRFTIWETRVFTKLVSIVKPGDEDFKKYRIYLKDILRDFELDSSNASYQELRNAANTLLQKELSIFEETEEAGLTETRTHLIVAATTQLQNSTGNYIELSFHPKIKPHIDKLKEKYTTYDVKNILNLPSTYSIRIYELLKQYEYRGKRRFELDEFKEIIGARETLRTAKGKTKIKDSYPLYGNFNQRVLKRAQQHLDEHTDICFTYEPIKQGRKVHKLEFVILENPRYIKRSNSSSDSKSTVADESEVSDEVLLPLFRQIEQYADEAALRRWLKTHTPAQLQSAIDYTLGQIRQGKKIDNVGGYIHTILNTDAVLKSEEVKRAKREQREKKLAEAKLLLEQVRLAYAEVQDHARAKIQETIEGIFDREPQAKIDAFETASKQRRSGYVAERSKAENMQDPTFRATFIAIIRKRHPEYFTEIKKIEKEASRLRSKISQLS